MTERPDPMALLFGSGAPTLQVPMPGPGFANGPKAGGTVASEPESYHAKEYDKDNPGGGAPAFYPSGDPKWGLRFDLKTAERTGPDDDGVRRLYVEKRRLRAAIRDAIMATGSDRLELGGELFVWVTGTEPGQGGGNPATTYAASYRRPGQVQLAGAATSTAAVAQQQMQQAIAPTVAQPIPTVVQGKPKIPATVAAAMVNQGMDISGYEIVP